MKTHHLIGATNNLTADEHGRQRWASSPCECLLDFPSSGHLVKLMDSRVHPKVTEESLDGVAHTACGLAKDHHWPLRCQLCHPLHFQISCVEQEISLKSLEQECQ